MVDLPVNGHGGLVQRLANTGPARLKGGQKVLVVGHCHLDLPLALGVGEQVIGEDDRGHLRPLDAYSPPSAASTRGGDSGRSLMRTPVASRTALEATASGATMGVSPTPRTP